MLQKMPECGRVKRIKSVNEKYFRKCFTLFSFLLLRLFVAGVGGGEKSVNYEVGYFFRPSNHSVGI